MSKLIAMTVGMVVATLIVPGIVHAQSAIAVQGTIQAADCQANTLTLNAADGSHVFFTSSSTAVFVNSAVASFCALPQYVGSGATVWVTASGDQLLVGRVDVSTAAAPFVGSAPNYGYGPYYTPYYGPYFYPFFGIGIYDDFRFHDRDFHRDRDFDHDRDFHHDRHFHGGGHGSGRH